MSLPLILSAIIAMEAVCNPWRTANRRVQAARGKSCVRGRYSARLLTASRSHTLIERSIRVGTGPQRAGRIRSCILSEIFVDLVGTSWHSHLLGIEASTVLSLPATCRLTCPLLKNRQPLRDLRSPKSVSSETAASTARRSLFNLSNDCPAIWSSGSIT